MAKLGFLGLGLMGYPMARNLARAGHQVAVWSNTASKAQQLASEEKATACASPKQVAEQADFIFACVGDTRMSEEVFTGANGVIEGAKPGTVAADASTISPAASRGIGAKLAAKGIHFLDAPCTGSTPGAINATLTFMIGGDQGVFEKTKPYLEAMGKQFYYCGGPGLGLQAKLTQNLILANLMQAFNEGLVLSTKGGIAPELMLDILEQQRRQVRIDRLQGPFRFQKGLHHQLFHKVDAQGHRPGARVGPGTGAAYAHNQPDRTDVSGCNCRGLRGRRPVRDHPGDGALGGRRGQGE